MQVEVNDRCTGHGRCYMLAPDVFVDDEEGYGQVIGDGEVPDHLVDAAKAVAVACPEGAVHLSE